MNFIVQFIIGGTVMVSAAYLSKSKYLFLSGVITLLPIMTLLNIQLQLKNMSADDFRAAQKNGIFGAFGAVIFISSIFILTNWLKAGHAVLGAFIIYIFYMIGCKCLL
ncbi:GlpM family protein [Bacillus sp. YC2]|uniref:GlpM family protein n=1 Tax=Bacillus sp. YC2 TaxID=2861287 RepID=UPI001CA70D27|nr:GlpM family protein [Bacillus sp. YC2]MBY8913570.1 GlpM family protein [Bacillus sp. YC2]